jgi:hypothetical protein
MKNKTFEGRNRALAKQHEARSVIVGDTILFELAAQGADGHTFGVGVVLDTTQEFLKFQWLGSYKYKETDKFRPGWIDVKDRKVYYNKNKTKGNHVRYENDENDVFLKEKDLLIWGDDVLTEAGNLSKRAKDALSAARIEQ